MTNLDLSFSTARVGGGHKAVLGPVRPIQTMYTARTELRSIIRFVGPSKFGTPDYEERVTGILEEIRAELAAFRDRIEIQSGVTDLGLDSMLSRVFYGRLPFSGVVSWQLPKVELTLADDNRVVLTEADYQAKKKGIAEHFRNLAMYVEGGMPSEGLCFDRPNFQIGNQSVTGLIVGPDAKSGFTELERFVIFGSEWATAYEMYRPGLAAIVVLGGGQISHDEAVTSRTLGKEVLCIDPKILPQEHRPGIPSASTVLVTNEGFPAYDARGIAERIKAIVGRQLQIELGQEGTG